MKKVERLRRDDHRYYHQCRINQTLHLISAVTFLFAYVALFFDPAVSGLVGWLLGMVTRQSGHIFFEPRGEDRIHHVSYEYKESIKVGYNMHRKGVLIVIWLSSALILAVNRSFFGWFESWRGAAGYFNNLGWLWLALGVAGVVFRVAQLFFLRGPIWGLAWAAKILTDPLHNIAIYWKSPLELLRGERFDPLDEQLVEQAAEG